MRRLALLPVLLGALLLTAPWSAHAEDGKDKEKTNWKEEAAYRAIQAAEAKALLPLLRAAVKEDFRRQAWFLADRLLAAKAGDAEAQGVLEKWSDADLQLGVAPTPEFSKKLAQTLQEFGDQYFRFGETLTGAGLDPAEFYEIHVIAHSYGSKASALLASLEQAGYAWLGTFHDVEQKVLAETYGPRWPEIVFPPMWDDGYLKVRIRWGAEARVAQAGPWKLITDLKPQEMLRVLSTLVGAQEHLVNALGGSAPTETTPVDVLLFSEAELYERVGLRFVAENDQKEYLARSAWYDRREGRVFACWRDRENAWVGEDSTLLHAAAEVIVRRHLGQGAAGSVNGRGAWLIDGIGGALEGLVVDPRTRAASIEPSRCWRLAAAKALRAAGVLLSWEKFLEIDAAKAKEWPKRTVQVAFRGGKFEAKDVDVAAAQATAFAVGILKADKGKGAKKLGDLLRDLLKRDALPDPDKVLGWKKGRWQAEADKAIDAATGL
jgi:hypothetical protein